MRVRLTRKLAQLVNGIDLSAAREGDTLELPPDQAALIVAEGWATPVMERSHPTPDRASDRPHRTRRPAAQGSRKPKNGGA